MKLTNEQKLARAKYQAEYRRNHPDYIKRCREREKPFLETYRQHTQQHFKDKIIKEYLRSMMLFGDGWKIEITHRKGKEIQTDVKMIPNQMVEMSNCEVIMLEVERMLRELKITPSHKADGK